MRNVPASTQRMFTNISPTWDDTLHYPSSNDQFSTIFMTPSLITHKPNLYHLKAGCLECVMGGGVSFFVPPQNFGEIGL